MAVLALVLAAATAQATVPLAGGHYSGTNNAKQPWLFDLTVSADATTGHLKLGIPARCRLEEGYTFTGGVQFELGVKISPSGVVSGSWSKVKRTKRGTYKDQITRDSVQVRGTFVDSTLTLTAKGSHVQTFRSLSENCQSRGWVKMHGTLLTSSRASGAVASASTLGCHKPQTRAPVDANGVLHMRRPARCWPPRTYTGTVTSIEDESNQDSQLTFHRTLIVHARFTLVRIQVGASFVKGTYAASGTADWSIDSELASNTSSEVCGYHDRTSSHVTGQLVVLAQEGTVGFYGGSGPAAITVTVSCTPPDPAHERTQPYYTQWGLQGSLKKSDFARALVGSRRDDLSEGAVHDVRTSTWTVHAG